MDTSLNTLLSNLTQSLETAIEPLPSEDALAPPPHGLSLLTAKNELMLSYLQHLVFLILLKLRDHGAKSSSKHLAVNHYDDVPTQAQRDAVRRLVELRLYLEKGVRPLESRLKYQIDKVVKAAEDAEQAKQGGKDRPSSRSARRTTAARADRGGSISEDDRGHNSNGDSQRDSSDDSSVVSRNSAHSTRSSFSEVDELSYRPNPATFDRSKSASKTTDESSALSKPGIYRPPRIAPTALPVMTSIRASDRSARRPPKSAVLDEFVSAELSGAPLAQPSVGSTIAAGGRRTKSVRERGEEAERRAYEEENFVRLPKEGKKEKARRKGREGAGYGGEEWRDLGAGLDRIEKLTRKGVGKRAVADGPRGDGFDAGRMKRRRR